MLTQRHQQLVLLMTISCSFSLLFLVRVYSSQQPHDSCAFVSRTKCFPLRTGPVSRSSHPDVNVLKVGAKCGLLTWVFLV